MYINLKVYTDYTLLEGVGKISDYVKKVSELGLKGLGLVCLLYTSDAADEQ